VTGTTPKLRPFSDPVARRALGASQRRSAGARSNRVAIKGPGAQTSSEFLNFVVQSVDQQAGCSTFAIFVRHIRSPYSTLCCSIISIGGAVPPLADMAPLQFLPLASRGAELVGETVYDPGCGTGGFLAQSFEFMALSKNSTEAAIHAAFCNTMNSVLVTAIRCAFSSR
jgi:hypothetical protein